MKEVSQLHIRVIDSPGGLFLPVAERFARDAKLVEYWTPAWEQKPRARTDSIGYQYNGVERIPCPFENKRDVDLWCFPDIDFGGFQMDLIEQGFTVWGGRNGDQLENSRGLFLKTLKKVGLSVPKFKAITGISPLIEYLKDNEDKYIKVSKHRGDWETMHFRSWKLDKNEVYARAVRLGPLGDLKTFYVFDPIDTIIEDGLDSFCIDGQWPQNCIHAMEKKNEGLLATTALFSEIPEGLRSINEAFSDELRRYGYRGDFSTEVRITEDGEHFFIDPTCRKASPVSQVQTELWENYTEYHWAGANGEIVEPKPTAQFGCQVLLKSTGNPLNWVEFELPEQLQQWVKCSNAMIVNGKVCIPPMDNDHGADVGWLCATGDSIRDCVATMKDYIKELPDGITADPYALADLIKEVEESEKQGLEFTDQPVPEPEIVVQ